MISIPQHLTEEQYLNYRSVFKPEDRTVLHTSSGRHTHYDIDFDGNVYNNRTGEKLDSFTKYGKNVVEISVTHGNPFLENGVITESWLIDVDDAVRWSFKGAHSVLITHGWDALKDYAIKGKALNVNFPHGINLIGVADGKTNLEVMVHDTTGKL